MRLPNGERAFIPPEKLTGYVLSETHPTGQSKARFFRAFGFTAVHAEQLAVQLLALARTADNPIASPSPHGEKDSIVGVITGSDGRRALVQTVWIIEHGDERPRVVPAYPA